MTDVRIVEVGPRDGLQNEKQVVPTATKLELIRPNSALRIYHGTFLSQPHPVPENLISANSDAYFGPMFEAKFNSRATRHYLAALRDPARIKALCEDYGAGAYADFAHDKTDLDNETKIAVLLHVIWGSRGIVSAAATRFVFCILRDDPQDERMKNPSVISAGVAKAIVPTISSRGRFRSAPCSARRST